MAAPSLTSLSPVSLVAGATGFTLTVNGTNFVAGAVVVWGTTPLTTSFVSATQLTATVGSDLVADGGNVPVTVLQAGVTSKALVFSVVDAPAAIDLTTLARVKAAIESMSDAPTSDDYTLQRGVTAASRYFLTRTDRASFTSISAYVERQDGNNRDQMLLREGPVTAASLVQIDNQLIPQTPDFVQPGWAINQDATGIVLIGYRFCRGRMNVLFHYSGGFSSVPEDVQEACEVLVSQNYKRRSWVDQASIGIPETGGQTNYRNWEVPPLVERAIKNYRRYHL